MIEEIFKQVERGEISPLKAYAQLKLLAKDLNDKIKLIEPDAMNEADRYGEKSFSDYGFSFQVREGATRWDYSHCSQWNEAKEHLKEVESTLKAAAISFEKGMFSVDADGVEVTELPVKKFDKPSLIVK